MISGHNRGGVTENIIWKTWVQECRWHGGFFCQIGSYNYSTAHKIAKKYTPNQAEYFVRAQFIMEQSHGFAVKGTLSFKHLNSEKCDRRYEDYVKYADTYADMQKAALKMQFDHYRALREADPEMAQCWSTQDHRLEYLVRAYLNYNYEVPYEDEKIQKLRERYAKEIIWWPGLMSLDCHNLLGTENCKLLAVINNYKQEVRT